MGDSKASSSVVVKVCAHCGKPAALLCARCLNTVYCNVACQRGAWKAHKRLCAPAVAATAVVAVAVKEPEAAVFPVPLMEEEEPLQPVQDGVVVGAADGFFELVDQFNNRDNWYAHYLRKAGGVFPALKGPPPYHCPLVYCEYSHVLEANVNAHITAIHGP